MVIVNSRFTIRHSRLLRSWMFRFVEPEAPAIGQMDRGDTAPPLLTDRRVALHTFPGEFSDRGGDVIAHQIEVEARRLRVARVNREFGWRQSEDQPSVSDIDVAQVENVSKERPQLLCPIRVH